MELALTPHFNVIQFYKAALTFERVWKLKFAFEEREF